MPKKCLTPGPLGQLARSSPDPTSLVQCARRRLQYSQLPVRCTNRRSSQNQQQRGKLSNSLRKFTVLGTPKRCVSAKNCCPVDAPGAARFLAVAAADSRSPAARKSLSMTDLSQTPAGPNDFEPAELRSDSGTSSARLDDGSERRTEETLSVEGCTLMSWTTGNTREERESRAACLVSRVLAVNAWRRRREEVAELRVTIADLNQQLDQLQLQIVVLRRLLDNENARVASLAGELHRAKAHVEDMTKERDQLKIEKEAVESEAQRQREIAEERSVSAENLRNELCSARNQLDALDKQIEKDREKLLKLREDKKILLEKVLESETLAAERATRADRAELSLEDVQAQLATQIALTASLQEEVQRFSIVLKEKEEEKTELEKMLQKMEEENIKVEERLRVSEERERALSSRAADLESYIVDQESKIKRIEATCSAQVLELNELRERLIQQSQECGWSSKVLQLAGSFARAPRVILRTLSFFSTGISLNL